MQDALRNNQPQKAVRAPADWLERRYHLPAATARLIAELSQPSSETMPDQEQEKNAAGPSLRDGIAAGGPCS